MFRRSYTAQYANQRFSNFFIRGALELLKEICGTPKTRNADFKPQPKKLCTNNLFFNFFKIYIYVNKIFNLISKKQTQHEHYQVIYKF